MKAASGETSVRERVDVEALYDPQDGAPRRYEFAPASYSAAVPADVSLSAAAPLRPPAEDPVSLLERLVAGLGAGRRILVLSGHGSGAVGDFLNDEKSVRALSIPLLGRILEGKSIRDSWSRQLSDEHHRGRVRGPEVGFLPRRLGGSGLQHRMALSTGPRGLSGASRFPFQRVGPRHLRKLSPVLSGLRDRGCIDGRRGLGPFQDGAPRGRRLGAGKGDGWPALGARRRRNGGSHRGLGGRGSRRHREPFGARCDPPRTLERAVLQMRSL